MTALGAGGDGLGPDLRGRSGRAADRPLLALPAQTVVFVVVATLLALAVLGGLGASAGGGGIFRGAMRVTLWGVLAMGATVVVGTLFGVTVG